MLTPTEFYAVEDKEKFINHFIRFAKSGYKRTIFPQWFYYRLSNCFGFIAHYDINGFYEEKFSSLERIAQFKNDIREWPCYGDTRHTFSDCEKIIKDKINFI